MILCNLALKLNICWNLKYCKNNKRVPASVRVFYRPELGGIVIENVNTDGSLSDTFDGRLINPGHAIEAMVHHGPGRASQSSRAHRKSQKITLIMLEYGWDENTMESFTLWTERFSASAT